MASPESIFSGQWLYKPVEIQQTINYSQQEWIAQKASTRDITKALIKNCKQSGLEFHGLTPSDGNCFFHAVSDQLDLLGLPSQSAVDLRQSVVTFMRNNSNIQGPEGTVDFTKLYPDWNGYCDRMSLNGEWADHVVLVAAAHLLQRDIMIVMSSPQSLDDQKLCWIRSGASFSGKPIMLGHLWEWHYQSLQTTNPHLKDNFIRLHLAVQYICQEVRPCISEQLKNWHNKQTRILQPCQTPQQCAVKGKPKPGKSCPACVAWGSAIEGVYYNHGQQNVQIPWSNVNPTLFHHDPIEVAKAFVLRLGTCKTYTCFGDFDTASILMLMKNFAVFHGNDSSAYSTIRKVLDVRHIISHVNIDDNLTMKEQDVESSFQAIEDFAQTLVNLHPKHFQNEIHKEVLKLKLCQVTADMSSLSQTLCTLSSDVQAKKITANEFSDEITKDDKFDVTTCQQELQSFYRKKLCMIPKIPGAKQECLEMDDIYTNLSILINLPKPCTPLQIPLKSHHEIFISQDKRVISRTSPTFPYSLFIYFVLLCLFVTFPFSSVVTIFPSFSYLSFLFTSSNFQYIIPLSLFLLIVLLRMGDLVTHRSAGYVPDGIPPTRILVLGNPGCGKSVLTLKLAHDWAVKNSDSPLKNVELVFVLNMRWMTPKTNLEDAIFQQLLPKDTKLSKTLLRDYIERNQSACIIILDSFDEYGFSGDFSKIESGVHDILLNDRLRECQVLVTSRFWKAGDFDELQDIYMQMQISGFSDQNVKEYVLKFFDNDTAACEKLLSYLIDHNLNPGIANVPLMTLLFCLYWKNSGGQEMPSKIGDLYSTIFRLLRKQYLSKNITEKIDLRPLVNDAGNVALSGLWSSEDKIVFGSQEFVSKSSEQTLMAGCKIGLLSIEQQTDGADTLLRAESDEDASSDTDDGNATCFDRNKCVTFFHKSFQEKCAGEYLANIQSTSPSDFSTKIQYLDSAKTCMRVEMVLRFACGASRESGKLILQKLMQIFRSEFSSHLQGYYQESLDPDETKLFQRFIELCLQCYYECPGSTDSHLLLNELFPSGQILFIGMSPYTSNAIGQYIARAKIVKSITIKAIPSPGDGGIITPGVIHKTYSSIQHTLKRLPSQQLQRLYQQVLSHSTSSDFDNLCKTEVTNYFKDWQSSRAINLVPIFTSLTMDDTSDGLDTLNLINVMLGSEITTLQSVIDRGSLNALRTLTVSNNRLTSEQVDNLLASIQLKLPSLEKLDISHNKARLEHLGDCLLNSKIRRLVVQEMKAPADDMSDVISKLPQFGSRMIELYMYANEIDDGTGKALADALPCAGQLQLFSISVNMMKRNTHNKVIKAMHHLTHLTQLKVKSCPYLDDLFLCLSSTMRSMPQLEILRLYSSHGEVEQFSPSTLAKRLTWLYSRGVMNRSACRQFMSTLDTMPNMTELMLSNIALHRQDLVTLLGICHRHNYKTLRYNRNLFPDDIDASQHEFLVFL